MITVVLSTYNRADIIRKCMTGFLSLRAPAGGWKLVVIDNGSTDHTNQVIAEFENRLPLHSLHHPTAGKNACLNFAIPHFQGDSIVFTDDDIIVHPDWLLNYQTAVTNNPGFSVFGGRIIPLWPNQAYEEIVKSVPVSAAYGVHPDSLESGPISSNYIWGGNMLVRRDIFNNGYKFNESLGPYRVQYIQGGEIEFTSRLALSGCRCFFLSENCVGHIIRSEQLTLRWIKNRAFNYGRQRFLVETGKHAPAKFFHGHLRQIAMLTVSFCIHRVRYHISCLNDDKGDTIRSAWNSNFASGWLHQAKITPRRQREHFLSH